MLRKPYHRLLNRGGRGVKVMVGGTAAVWIPAEFAGGNWERYEPEAVAIFSAWVHRHPGGLVLDLGSSIGLFSAVALFADPSVEVVAFDSDLSSLAAARRICRHAPGSRLRLVHGLLAQAPTDNSSLASAVITTEEALLRTGARGDAGTTRYICITDPDAHSVPRRRLDDLLAASFVERRSMLIKCDVEGAELLVLQGAEKLLRRARPDLLLSVHPLALPTYGHSKTEVEAFLENLGYEIRCIAVDHEEHWWCVIKCLE